MNTDCAYCAEGALVDKFGIKIGELPASGFTRHAFVSTKDFRPCPPPQELVAKMMGESKK